MKRKVKRFEMRCSASDLRQWRALARSRGQSLTEWIRRALADVVFLRDATVDEAMRYRAALLLELRAGMPHAKLALRSKVARRFRQTALSPSGPTIDWDSTEQRLAREIPELSERAAAVFGVLPKGPPS